MRNYRGDVTDAGLSSIRSHGACGNRSLFRGTREASHCGLGSNGQRQERHGRHSRDALNR